MGVFDNLFKRNKEPEGENISINRSLKLFVAACIYYKSGNYASAITITTDAIKENPSNVNFYTLRGTSYEALDKLPEAEADLKKALQIQPN